MPEASSAQYARQYWQITGERALAANGALDALIRKTPTERLPELVENPILRNYGALEYLGRIFTEILGKDPNRAKAIAELEISLAENLPQGMYLQACILQGHCYAWRDLGMALRTLGRPEQSLEALRVAERHASPHRALGHDVAIVRLSTAITLQELERYDESRDLLGSIKRVFRQHGDHKRLILATFTEGLLLQRLRNFREARESYLLLLNTVTNIEPDALAAIHRAIGLCSVELGDFPNAEVNLTRSITLNEQLAQSIEAAKGRAALGRLMIRRGDTVKAIAYLRPVRREFLRHGLIEEAGICGLEIVEGMLALGNASAAGTLARRIIGEFMNAGLNKRAITALGYLQESIASAGASTALVSKVREYIVSLRISPERDFVMP